MVALFQRTCPQGSHISGAFANTPEMQWAVYLDEKACDHGSFEASSLHHSRRYLSIIKRCLEDMNPLSTLIAEFVSKHVILITHGHISMIFFAGSITELVILD